MPAESKLSATGSIDFEKVMQRANDKTRSVRKAGILRTVTPVVRLNPLQRGNVDIALPARRMSSHRCGNQQFRIIGPSQLRGDVFAVG